MPIPKIKYLQMTYKVDSAGQQIAIEAETDKLYNTVTGINVMVNAGYSQFSTLQLDINGLEVFPANFEIIRIMFRSFVPFGFDYHTLNEPAGGSRIKGTYIDRDGSNYPYNFTISLRLENKEPTDAGRID